MPNPKDITVLIVDDEDDLREAMVYDFKKKGYSVLDAGSGNKAIAIVGKNKIDIVITDVRMADGDGVQLLERIRMQSHTLPVVMFITGFADLSVIDAYDKGADALFHKPFDMKALHAAVVRATTPKDEVWTRSSERFAADFAIKLSLAGNLREHIAGKVLDIGRGGMFVTMEKSFPELEAKVEFQIHFGKGPPNLIEGQGTVRWVRSKMTDGHPPGCGIEFDNLTDACRRELIQLINSIKTKAYIPKE